MAKKLGDSSVKLFKNVGGQVKVSREPLSKDFYDKALGLEV